MKIVMIDQDGVLLDRNYETTLDLNGFLKRLPKGIVVVPNSDTPIERIRANFMLAAGMYCWQSSLSMTATPSRRETQM